jgi:DegV family protein with EDD domain
MDQVKIVTDGGADLSSEVAQELDISIVPLTVTFGDKAYLDSELSREAFWDLVHRGLRPQTSQPSVGLFQQAFQKLVEAGHDVICTTITGRHSGTYNSAWTAAQGFEGRVRVFDTLSLSMGQGRQAIHAARMALQGATADRIIEAVESVKRRTRMLIQLETIENIRRGGRAARLMPVIERLAKVLSLRPILSVVDGELTLLGVARSTPKGLRRLQEEFAALGALEFLAVMHVRCRDVAEQVADELSHLLGVSRAEIWIGEAGPALACHGGEGVISIIGVVAE